MYEQASANLTKTTKLCYHLALLSPRKFQALYFESESTNGTGGTQTNSAATILHTINMRIIKGEPDAEVHPTFTLSTNNQIATLEAKLYLLCARKPNQASNICMRAQAQARNGNDEDSNAEDVAAIRGNQCVQIEEVIEETPAFIP